MSIETSLQDCQDWTVHTDFMFVVSLSTSSFCQDEKHFDWYLAIFVRMIKLSSQLRRFRMDWTFKTPHNIMPTTRRQRQKRRPRRHATRYLAVRVAGVYWRVRWVKRHESKPLYDILPRSHPAEPPCGRWVIGRWTCLSCEKMMKINVGINWSLLHKWSSWSCR